MITRVRVVVVCIDLGGYLSSLSGAERLLSTKLLANKYFIFIFDIARYLLLLISYIFCHRIHTNTNLSLSRIILYYRRYFSYQA